MFKIAHATASNITKNTHQQGNQQTSAGTGVANDAGTNAHTRDATAQHAEFCTWTLAPYVMDLHVQTQILRNNAPR
jgi:hypothetical protein